MTDASLHFRPAIREDARLLFDLRNDEETRLNSITTAPLEWDSHVGWLEKLLAGGFPGRALYIVEAEGEPVGTVRSDEREDGLTEVSYIVAPSARGRGIGKRMVLEFVTEKLQGKKLAVRVKKGVNPASENIARALGLAPFSETSEESPIVEWR